MILKGELTALGNATRYIHEKGMNNNLYIYQYLEIGKTRTRKVSVDLDMDDQLNECLGQHVELSFHKSLRWGLHGRHIIALKTHDGHIYKSGYIISHLRLILYYVALSVALVGVPVYWWYSSKWYGDDLTALVYATVASLPIITWGVWRYIKARNAFGKENLGRDVKRL